MFGLRRRAENRAIQSITDTDFARATGKMAQVMWLSAAHIDVSVKAALGVPAVWAAVNFISGTIAGLPVRVYRRTRDGGREPVSDPLSRLLQSAATDEMSMFDWKKYIVEQILTGGRGVSFIERAPSGRVINLWPLDPERITIRRSEAGRKTYFYDPPGGRRRVTYQSDEIIDLPFMLDRDQLTAFSPIHRNRDVIALAIAATQYASKYFQNGGVPPFAITGNFQSGSAMRRAAEDLERAVQTAAREDRQALVLPAGLDIKDIGAAPDKGQLLELKQFMIEEVARIYSLPPVFLQDLTHAKYANTEQQDLHFVKHTVKRWVEQIEQEMTLKLFGRVSQKYVEFDLSSLLRGDFKTRMEGHAQAIQNGIETPNEARMVEGRSPLPGGDRLMIQGATVPLEGQENTQPPPAGGDGGEEP